ncbi:Master replication protein [Mizuhopecten yessoensis]|uniref:Master replication protein n=1 Tax=Mizuhopecten yessoensis TaxID=6573 RepID=A0A210Q9R0_MIZYE|nr:Master replication protein [Mizuhopecten yessoensis]
MPRAPRRPNQARRMVTCDHCHKQMNEQNLARHTRTCKENPDNADIQQQRKQYPGVTFFITWQSHVKYIAEQLGEMHEDIKSFIICDELGAGQEPHEHSHAVIIMHPERKMTFDQFKHYWEIHDLPEYQDIQACKNVKQAVKYCSKEDYLCHIMAVDHDYLSTLKLAWCYSQRTEKFNPLHYPYCRMIPGEQRKFKEFYDGFIYKEKQQKAKDGLENCVLHPWQKKVYDMMHIQDDRTVMWLYDEEGNKGKTFLSQYMAAHEDCIVLENGGKKDLAFAYQEQEYVVFDFTRSMEEHINYSFIEALKNGRIFSSKYESHIKIFNPAKVLCCANLLPDKTKLSADRWMIWGIINENRLDVTSY